MDSRIGRGNEIMWNRGKKNPYDVYCPRCGCYYSSDLREAGETCGDWSASGCIEASCKGKVVIMSYENDELVH